MVFCQLPVDRGGAQSRLPTPQTIRSMDYYRGAHTSTPNGTPESDPYLPRIWTITLIGYKGSAERRLENWCGLLPVRIRANWRLSRGIRRRCGSHLRLDYTLKVPFHHFTLVEPELSLAPSIYTTGRADHWVLLRWRLLLKGRRRCYHGPGAGHAKVEDSPAGQRTVSNPTGVTVKGLMALARNCRDLSRLRIHFRTASFGEAATSPRDPSSPSDDEPVIGQQDCALTELEVGAIPIQGNLRVDSYHDPAPNFPSSSQHQFVGGRWKDVLENIRLFKRFGTIYAKQVRRTSRMFDRSATFSRGSRKLRVYTTSGPLSSDLAVV
jgi:hypothetical protein